MRFVIFVSLLVTKLVRSGAARWGRIHPGSMDVLVNMDGDGKNISKTIENMYFNRAQLAQDMLELTHRWNFSGYTLDWVQIVNLMQ